MSSLLVRGAQFRVGALGRSASGAWVADSVTLRGADGRLVAAIGQVTLDVQLGALLRGQVVVGTVAVERPHVWLDATPGGEWNVARIMAASTPREATRSSQRRLVTIDSVAISEGTIEISQAGAAPEGAAVRRRVSAMHAALGAISISSPTASGGSALLRTLSFHLDQPALSPAAAGARIAWWDDSLSVELPSLTLPASRLGGSARIAWPVAGRTMLTADARVDSLSFSDLRALVTRLPPSGTISGRIAVRPDGSGSMRIEARGLVARSGHSEARASGAFVTGRVAQLRDLAVTVAPLDIGLARQLLGEVVLGPAWQGDASISLAARGGPLDSLVVDSVALTFHDTRAGAVSSLRAAGTLNLAESRPRLIEGSVRVDSLAIRTLGALAPAADSVAGIVEGSLRASGGADAIEFHDMRLRHAQPPLQASVLSGRGTLRPGREGRWLELDVALDTVAVASLAHRFTTAPLRGTPHGAVLVTATADTFAIDARLADGEASVRVAGTALLAPGRTRVALDGAVRGLDPRRFVARADIPEMRLSGAVAADMEEGSEGSAITRRVALQLDSTSRIGESAIRRGNIRAGLDAGGFHLDTVAVVADGWSVHARGKLAADSSATDTLTFSVLADSLAVLRAIVLDSAGAPSLPDLGGRVSVSDGVLTGSMASLALRAHVHVDGLTGAGVTVDSGTVTVNVAGLPGRGSGSALAALHGLAAGPARFDAVTARARMTNGERGEVTWAAAAPADSIAVSGGATLAWPDSIVHMTLDSLRATVASHEWQLAAPSRVRSRAGLVEVDSVTFRSNLGAVVTASASWPERGPVRGDVVARRMEFGEVAFMGIVPPQVSGVADLRAHVSGTRSAPVIDAAATLDSIRWEDRAGPTVTATVRYADQKAAIALDASSGGRRMLAATGDIPLDLSFRDVARRVLDAPMTAHLAADSVALAQFEGLFPGVRNIAGIVNGDVRVSGALRQPRGSGALTLTDGGFEMPRAGVAARGVSATITLAGDSLIVERVRASDTESQRDTAAAWGVVRLAGERWTEWTVNMRSVAHEFRVIDDPRLATTKANWNLAVAGKLGSPRVSGDVTLPYAVFTIGPQRRQRNPLTDSTGAPPPGTPLAEGVVVTLGSNVRLRSREANVQLAGSVELFGPLNRPWVSGTVQATRGTYRVDLGVLKRTFLVDSGAVILEGTTDVPAALDINASYVVRQPESDDVTIRAHLYGTTDRPRLDLSSDLGTAIGPSEIISYLVFGKPSFAVPENSKATVQTAYQALVPSFLGGWIEGALGTVLPFFNTLQVATVGRDDPRLSATNPIEGLLSSFAVTGGRQVGTDTFISVTTGVCTGSTAGTPNNSPFWFGATAEYRPKRTLGAAVSIDPGPAPCSRLITIGNAYQFGFDLLRDWRPARRP